MSRVLDVTPSDLLARRATILSRLGVTYDDLLKRAEVGALSGEEYDALDHLRDIAYLLGDD